MEEISSEENLLNVLNSLRKKLLEIKKKSDDSSPNTKQEISKLLNEGLFDLIEIKRLNEIIQTNSENKKIESEEKQSSIGKTYLELSKYEYNLELIKDDIEVNKQMPQFPESIKVISEEKKVNNIIKEEAFENILLNRKRMDKSLKDLKDNQKKYEKLLKKKKENLEEIPKGIKKLRDNINDIKKLFNNEDKNSN